MGLDLLTTVNRFILAFAAPPMPQERLYRGYQNRTTLLAAEDGEEYCIFAISDTKRIGTNLMDYGAAALGKIGAKSMREYVVEIDFVHTEEFMARQRAETIETAARSFSAVDFFRQHGYGLLYSDDIRPLPYVLGTEQYVYRFRLSLHISGWSAASMPQEYFEKIELGSMGSGPYFENVDVHHPKRSDHIANISEQNRSDKSARYPSRK